jgi:heme/copper-type cytochrome/quinol oxidase subunit 3
LGITDRFGDEELKRLICGSPAQTVHQNLKITQINDLNTGFLSSSSAPCRSVACANPARRQRRQLMWMVMTCPGRLKERFVVGMTTKTMVWVGIQNGQESANRTLQTGVVLTFSLYPSSFPRLAVHDHTRDVRHSAQIQTMTTSTTSSQPTTTSTTISALIRRQ